MTSPALPFTIKAIIQPSASSTHLTLTTLPLPSLPSPTSYLIHIHATSPCRDELTWELSYPSLFPASRIRIPCTEAAGTVVRAPATGAFKVGDPVFYRRDAHHEGALREYSVAEEEELARKPDCLSWQEAAATPLSSLTAWQGLFVHGLLDPRGLHGDQDARERNGKIRVLVSGAGGGVASWAVPLALAAGAESVTAVGSASKIASVTATSTVPSGTVASWVSAAPAERQCDFIFDTAGGPNLGELWTALRAGGTFLSVAGAPEDVKPEGFSREYAKAQWFLVKPLGSNLAEIASVIEKGVVRPTVDSVYEFEQFAEAFEKVEKGRPRGKVVINVSA